MDFVKKNLISVIAIAVAIIGIPAMVYFSSGMKASHQKTLDDGVKKAMQPLQNPEVEYTLPVTDPATGQMWSKRTSPTPLKNETMREILERLKESSAAERAKIEERNSAGKTLLIDDDPQYGDLFPKYADESARVALLTKMMAAYPEAHDEMLRDARVRDAPDAERVVGQIEARRTREIASIIANREDQNLSEDEMAQVRTALGEFRKSLYEAHARETVFYGAPSMFVGLERLDRAQGDELISLERAWDWQHRTWVNQDLITAFVTANTDEDGEGTVQNGPVKRVLSIAIDPVPLPQPEPAGGANNNNNQNNQGGGAQLGGLDQPVALDYTVAHTGLNAWPARPNQMYDLRYATIRMIADGDRIGEIVAALSVTNLMNVIDFDFKEYDGDQDLPKGYDYGTGQMVALTLRVESAWLRSWMKTDMPETIRAQLGIAPDPEPVADQSQGGNFDS